jgi:hypothetical protein
MTLAYTRRSLRLSALVSATAILGLATVGTAILSPMPDAHAQSRAPAPPPCVRHDLPVTLTATPRAPTYRIGGWLCQPAQPTSTVQILVSGLTYSHRYWTGFGTSTDYVNAAVAAGDAVYLFDRPGIGASDHPPADQITATAEASVLHQITAGLRDGRLGRFHRLVGVGHSFGSFLWLAETAAYHDTDALVLTGLLHDSALATFTTFTNALHPASDDPDFTGVQLPDGYLTTIPGSRAGFFLNVASAVPAAAAWDELNKATTTSGELDWSLAEEDADSQAIREPVLLIVGGSDALFCGHGLPCSTGRDICDREHGHFPSTTALAATVIGDTGHSLNLHRTAPEAFAVGNDWLNDPQRVPSTITRCTS